MGTSQTTLGDKSAGGLEPSKVFSAPLGAASPLWLAFMGAASAGVAFWWMSRWVRPFKSVAVAVVEPTLEPIVISAPAPVAEPVMATPVEAAFDAPVEAAAETVDVVEAAFEAPVEIIETAEADTVLAASADAPTARKPAPKKRPPASAARISARTKRRQPADAGKAPSKRR